MNEKGVAALVDAALRGQKQNFDAYEDIFGDALCALGVLGFREAAGYNFDRELNEHIRAQWEAEIALCRAYDLRAEPQKCPECDAQVPGEARLISHLNDDHRADFLKIARTLGAA